MKDAVAEPEAVRARDLVRNRHGIAGVGSRDDARRRVERDAEPISGEML